MITHSILSVRMLEESVQSLIRLWPYVLLLGLFTYYITTSVRAYWRLRQFKGPPLAAWTNLWWVYAGVSRKGHLYLYEACNKYGDMVRIGPNTVVTFDTEHLRKMNSVRSDYVRGDWYRAFRFDADRENLFSEVNEDRHTRMRQKVTAGYSGKENPNLEPDIDQVMWVLIRLINKKYLSQGSVVKPMDFANIMQFFTLDVITALSLGQSFGWLADEEDKYEYVKTMEDNTPAMNLMSAVPFLARILRIPAVQRAVLPTVRDRIGMGKIKAVAHEIIARRFGPEKEMRDDMTQSFISHGLTQAEIADESLLQILAGSDTSATLLRSMFIQIITNHRVYSKLQMECTSTDIPMSEIISNSRAVQLPYLNACIKEANRYHPVASGLAPRKVGPKGDIAPDGRYLPPGTEIGVSVWNAHRHNPLYGADAGIYRPERWLEADTDQLAKMDRAHDLVFSSGKYRCIGERIAKMEILKTAFELMRRFEFSFIDPAKLLEKEDNFGLWIQKGMWVRVEERSA